MQRRQFIRLSGGGLVWGAVAGAGLAGCSSFEVPPGAVAAWQPPAAPQGDLRRWLLAHALLAPNPHNQQPWQADLATPGQIGLRLDPQRLLPATDPFGRQILLGAGAFLELLVMAAAARGHRAEVALFPQGAPGPDLPAVHRLPFATVRLVADAAVAPDPLFAQVLRRRTDRRAYDPARPPSAEALARLRAAAATQPVRFGSATAADGGRLAAIQSIAREAWRTELTTEPAMMESVRLLRVGAAEIDQHRDGISITSPMLVALDRLGLFDRSRFPAADSQAVTAQLKDFDAITASTPAYFWLVTEGNSRPQQVAAGRAHVRVNLAATAAGLVLHPNQQALQEYPEVAKPYQAVHALLDAPAPRFTVQMLARLGHLPAGTAAALPAPRRGLARQFAV
ncbi:Acg family FMN-binding oxidoreductase [Pseudaquabacterium pictum]|uniref:Twin-arginine translocation pathway signal protein n=1 Tax=Pseudaquabacterium pictum TaxID=2315236 RepID=A0A480B0N3_9BURK|nr:twin-arginine translocation pathway signal protein [Rubrivivax pictus]GCL64658.1 hypothetical protein AQPW35_37390 [Rubrivivax pictus]